MCGRVGQPWLGLASYSFFLLGFAPLRSHVVTQLEDDEEQLWVPNMVDMILVSRTEAERGPGLGEWVWGPGCSAGLAACWVSVCTGILVLRPVTAFCPTFPLPFGHTLWSCHVYHDSRTLDDPPFWPLYLVISLSLCQHRAVHY